MRGAIGYPWVEELSGGSPPRVRGGGRARGSQLISPAPSELPGSVLLLHKPAGRLGDALTLESAVEESQAHCPSSYPAHRAWEMGSGGLRTALGAALQAQASSPAAGWTG